MSRFSRRLPRGRLRASLAAAFCLSILALVPGSANAAPVQAADICHDFGWPVGNICIPAPSVAPTVASLPSVTGTAREGESIGCAAGTFGRPNVTIDFPGVVNAIGIPDPSIQLSITSTTTTWLKNGSPDGPAGSRGLTADDVGKNFACRTVAVGGVNVPIFGAVTTGTRTSTSSPVTVAAMALSNVSPPTISGTAREGNTLTCSPGSWSPAPESSSLQWLRNGAVVGSGSSRLLSAADVGSSISCRESVSRMGQNGSATSAAVTPDALPVDPPDNNNNNTGGDGGGSQDTGTPPRRRPTTNGTDQGSSDNQGDDLAPTGQRSAALAKCKSKYKKSLKKAKKAKKAGQLKKAKKLTKKAKKSRTKCATKARVLPV